MGIVLIFVKILLYCDKLMYLVYGRIVYLDMFLISKLVLVILICDINFLVFKNYGLNYKWKIFSGYKD